MILETLNDHQMDKLMTDFQRTDKMEILEYLLKNSNEWTAISETMCLNSKDNTKDKQIRRLLNKHKNGYSRKVENGKMIIDLLRKRQGDVMKWLIDNLNQAQKSEILMQILTMEQRTGLF